MAISFGSDQNGIPLWNDKQGFFQIQNASCQCSPTFENGFLYFSDFNDKSRKQSAQRQAIFNEYFKTPAFGLKIKKTRSFVELIEKKLNSSKASQPKKEQKAGKTKAVHFPISLLRIGGFTIVAAHEGDLVGKCYYAKRKLVWEILDNGLKNKIEVQWQDILAMRAILQENRPGILQIEINQQPMFFHESDPKPRKHTIWKASADFTGGQASIFRRHYLEFPPGVLEKHYEKLIRWDNRLLQLSKGPFPSLRSPYFELSCGNNNMRGSITYPESGQPFSRIPAPMICTQQVQQFGHAISIPSSLGVNDLTSPTSVIDILHPQNEFFNKTRLEDQGIDDFANFQATNSMSSESDVEDLHRLLGSNNNNESSSIARIILFTDTDSETVGKERQMAKIKSLSTFAGLSMEADPTNNNTRVVNSRDATTHGPEEQYPASYAVLQHVDGEGRLLHTQPPHLHVYNHCLEIHVPDILHPPIIHVPDTLHPPIIPTCKQDKYHGQNFRFFS